MTAFWAACLFCRRPLQAMAYLLRIASGGSETPAACQGQWTLAIGPRRTIRLRSGIDVVADRRSDRLRLRGCHFSGLAAIVTAVIIGARFHRGMLSDERVAAERWAANCRGHVGIQSKV